MNTRFRHARACASLLLRARSIVRLRCRAGRYDLSDSAVNVLVNGFTEVAIGPFEAPADLRDEAVALAHRVLDDDQPEPSALWPDEHLTVTTWRAAAV